MRAMAWLNWSIVLLQLNNRLKPQLQLLNKVQ
jgi:hypothetical protein